MKIKKVVTTKYVSDEGFEFYHEPVEDSLTITETPEGFEARYLVQDNDAQPPNEYNDDNDLFLVNFHRDFWIENKKVITENDLQNWYRKDFSDYDDGEGNLPDDILQADEYWIFPLAAYIHSGVRLSLGSGSYFPDQRWDVSHVGAVLVSKKEWTDQDKAREAAEGLVETWNQFLSGDVYGIVKETYNKEKDQVDQDSCWGFYGHKYALEALKTEI